MSLAYSGSIRRALLLPILGLIFVALAALIAVAYFAYTLTQENNTVILNAVRSADHALHIIEQEGKIHQLIVDYHDTSKEFDRAELQAQYYVAYDAMNANLNLLSETMDNPKIRALLGEIRSKTDLWIDHVTVALGIQKFNPIIARESYKTIRIELHEDLHDVYKLTEKIITSRFNYSQNKFTESLTFIIGVVLLVFAAISLVTFQQLDRIIKSLKDISTEMGLISAGNYQTIIPDQNRRDEIGAMARHLQHFADSLSELGDAKIQAEDATRAKSQFLANMSHEIRTPMNGILAMAHFLSKSELSSKQKMFTDVIVRSGKSLVAIINDILDFSKLEAGQMTLDEEPFHLGDTLFDVITLFSATANEKDLEIIVRMEPHMPINLIGDAGRLRQILSNLVGNAIKFTEKGHIFIEISKYNAADPTQFGLKVAVSDTGIGMPKESLSTIFDQFSQVDTSATRKHEGTGLGLAISAAFIKLMGGEISVESEEGKGTTFSFTLELPLDESLADNVHTYGDQLAGKRLLIVDDNPMKQKILCEHMQLWQVDGVVVPTGGEALEFLSAALAHNVCPDMILMSYELQTDINGPALLEHLNSNESMKNIPVIVLALPKHLGDIELMTNVNVARTLAKPAPRIVIYDTMRDALAHAERSSQAA